MIFKRRQFTVSPIVAAIFSALSWIFIFSIGSAQAHDFWIEPERFRPALGDKVPLHLYVGMDFKGDSAPFIPEWFERYIYVGSQGEKPVPGTTGDDPAGAVPITTPGLTVVGYRSTQFSVTFDTLEEFERYLLKEGLERNLALAKKNRSQGKIVENYYRCAKSLLMTKNTDAPPDRTLGFRIELIAEKSPYAQAKKIPFRLLYEKHPLAGALVVAFNKAAPLEKLKARTDQDGRVTLDFHRRGTWLVTAVHMIPAPAGSGAQWESAWASLSFERP